jgi:hypothetical protein
LPSAGRGVLAAVAALVLWQHGTLAASRRVPPDRWHDIKCERDTRAWDAALAHFGQEGLSRDFLDRHAAFLASNCTRRADVCARSPEELRLANIMVELSMNAGTASTFPPFYCRD